MSGAPRRELVDVEVTLEYETERAILVINARGDKIWLPKSRIEYEPASSGKNRYIVTLQADFAEEKELGDEN